MMRSALLLALLFPAAAVRGQTVPVAIETSAFRFEAAAGGSYRLTDKSAGAIWSSAAGRFGQISVLVDGKPVRYPLAAFEAGGARHPRTLTFPPIPSLPDAWVRAAAPAGRDNRSLDPSYETAPGLKIEDIRILDEAFAIAASEKGYVVVPVREGLLIPSEIGRAHV